MIVIQRDGRYPRTEEWVTGKKGAKNEALMLLGRWLNKTLSYGFRPCGPFKGAVWPLAARPTTYPLTSLSSLRFIHRPKSYPTALNMAGALKQGEFVGSLDCGTT